MTKAWNKRWILSATRSHLGGGQREKRQPKKSDISQSLSKKIDKTNQELDQDYREKHVCLRLHHEERICNSRKKKAGIIEQESLLFLIHDRVSEVSKLRKDDVKKKQQEGINSKNLTASEEIEARIE